MATLHTETSNRPCRGSPTSLWLGWLLPAQPPWRACAPPCQSGPLPPIALVTGCVVDGAGIPPPAPSLASSSHSPHPGNDGTRWPQFTATNPSTEPPSARVTAPGKPLPTHLRLREAEAPGICGDPHPLPPAWRLKSLGQRLGVAQGHWRGESDRNSPQAWPSPHPRTDSPPTQHRMTSGPGLPPSPGTAPEWGRPRGVTSGCPLPSDRDLAGAGLRRGPPGGLPPNPIPPFPGISGPSPSDVTGGCYGNWPKFPNKITAGGLSFLGGSRRVNNGGGRRGR